MSEQGVEIPAVNDGMKKTGRRIRVLRSIELNLSPRGEGDMDTQALERLDIVLGCFHSSLRKQEDQTARYLAALRNPSVHILGHPRGRIYNFRLRLAAEMAARFRACREAGQSCGDRLLSGPAGSQHEAGASGQKIGLPYFPGH